MTKTPDLSDMFSSPLDVLTARAQLAFKTFRVGQSEYELTKDVAYTVGGQSMREGFDDDEVSRWLQTAYGSVFVIEGQGIPHADLKQIRKWIDAGRRTFQKNATRWS